MRKGKDKICQVPLKNTTLWYRELQKSPIPSSNHFITLKKNYEKFTPPPPIKLALCILSILATISFSLSSCQKEASNSVVASDPAVVQKVTTWVNSQKTGRTEAGVIKIQSLINAIDISKIRTEQLNEKEKMLIVSLDKSFKTKYNKDKNPINVLLLIENEAGEIRRGHIVQFVPASGKNINDISKNTFHNIYNNKKLSDDGSFTFLNVLGNCQFEYAYNNGKMSSSKVYEKDKSKLGVQRTNQGEYCIDWYLVTTYYYVDGTTETTREYLFSTCSDCNPTQDCEAPGGGGGSNGNGEEVYDFEVGRDQEWNVTQNPAPNGSGQIKSYERLKGRRVSSEPQGGHFTQASHYWSSCNFCSSEQPYNVWVEQSGSSTIISAQLASSTVSGYLNFNGVNYPGISNTNTWTFQAAFP